MRKLVFTSLGVAIFSLAACNSNNQDAVNNAELNQPAVDQLNDLSNNAANDAGETLGNQQNQLNENAAADENVTNPTDEQEQNVSGM